MKYQNIYNKIAAELCASLDYDLSQLLNFEPGTTYKTYAEFLKYYTLRNTKRRAAYAGTTEQQTQKLTKALRQKHNKDLAQVQAELNAIAGATPCGRIVISVEWKKSYIWGMNPSASDNYGRESGSIGGCGYDKLSTAVAEVLNQNEYFLKLIHDRIEAEPETDARELLGYGLTSGRFGLYKFAGGVGVSCYETIFKRLGWNFEHVSSTKTSDFFIITPGVE